MPPVGIRLYLQGFAKFAKSKGYPRTANKLFVYFVCASGFIYQTWEFLQMYLSYETTLHTTEENPYSFMEPAITVCDRNRVLRQRYCKTFPEKCTWEHTTWQSFCDSYRRMCPETKPTDFNFGIPIFNYRTQLDRSNAYLNAIGPQEDSNLIDDCMHFGRSYIPLCNSTRTAVQVIKYGLPHRCFSLFSLLLKPYEETSNLTVDDRKWNLITDIFMQTFKSAAHCGDFINIAYEGYDIQLHMHPEEYFNTIHLVQASVVFHDPRKAVNPMSEGIVLTAGKAYNLFPTMERKESLPPPYASNCMDYLKEWKKNGGSGPLSRDDCMDQCKMEAMMEEYGCVGHTISYPNKFPVCRHINTYVSSEGVRRCASSCRDACEENIYSVTSSTVLDYHGLCNATDEYCKSQYLHIRVSFNRMKIKKFKQIPRIESIELFSYIGGYLGIWLGISLASVFDLGDMIYDAIDSSFLKRRRKKETTTLIEQVGH